MMIVGVILVVAAAVLFAIGPFMVEQEEDSMKRAWRFDGSAAVTARQGDLVMVEGKVSAKNRILIHDYVIAAKENNDAGTWAILEEYHQPVRADLKGGEIILTADHVCTSPEGNNVLNTDERTPNNDPIRFVGLKRGDPITAIGTLTSQSPAALAVKYWHSGSIADYKNFLSSSRKGVYIFCTVIAALGAGLFLWGLKNK